MTTYRLLLTVCVGLLAPATAFAQPGLKEFAPPPAPSISYEGNEVFRWLLQRAELRPLTDAELDSRRLRQDYSDTVVIVLGRTQMGWVGGQQIPTWVANALRGG